MISKLLLTLKLFKYMYNKKSMIYGTVIFFILGLIYLFVMPEGGLISFCGLYFVAMSPLMLFQNLPTLCCSQLIASSEHTRHLTTSSMTIGQLLAYTVDYGVEILLCYIGYSMGKFGGEEIGQMLIMVGCLMGVLTIYNITAYKSFIISTAVFFVCAVGLFGWAAVGDNAEGLILNVSPVAGGALGYVIVLVCSGLAYGLSKLLYKVVWDKKAMNRFLKNNA